MDDTKVSITLTGPAKIDGIRRGPGYTGLVTTAIALQLAAAGVINPVSAGEDVILSSDVEAYIRGVLYDRDVNWSTALDHFETMAEDKLNAALDDLQAQRDLLVEAQARIAALEAERDAGRARVGELEVAATADAERIAALEVALKSATSPPTDPPPKTASKSQTK